MLTPTRIFQNVITGFTGAGSVFKRDDASETVIVSVVHFNLPVAEGVAYKVDRSGAVMPLAQSEVLGKDNFIWSLIWNNGDLWVGVGEADPGGGGASSHLDIYEYAGAFPAITSSTVNDPIARQAAAAAQLTANIALDIAQRVRLKVNEILNSIKAIINVS